MLLKDQIKKAATDLAPQLIKWRRHMHKHPELSYKEHKTMDYISSQLSEMNIEHSKGVADTGVVAIIKGKNPDSRVIALRSDHDALPIIEANEVDYASTNPGVMHACGHDAHTASLLGAASILNSCKDSWEGTIKLLFQPGEERLPGGATLMIKDGALQNPAPEKIIGQHVFPDLPAGHVGLCPGTYMASADELHMEIIGKGGHAALPEGQCNPILVASEILLAFEDFIENRPNKDIKTVLSFGFIEGNGATNIVPNSVKLEGTFRSLDEEWRFFAHKKMQEIVSSICQTRGANAHLDIKVGYPCVHNNPELTERLTALATEYLGADKVHRLPVRMTAEDFSFYAQQIPGCFYRLGTSSPETDLGHSGLHTPTFDIDESALVIGAGLLAFGAVNS